MFRKGRRKAAFLFSGRLAKRAIVPATLLPARLHKALCSDR